MTAPGAWVELPPVIDDDEARRLAEPLLAPVALTGATGFVGSHVLDVLVRGGAEVRVLVRDPQRLSPPAQPRVTIIEGSLESPGVLKRLVSGAGTVLHLAGLVRAHTERAFDEVNRGGTAAVAGEVARESLSARFVYVSSLAAAGPSASPEGGLPEDPPHPVSAYGRSKLGGERAVMELPGRWCIVRPPAIYGPRDIDVLQFFRMASRGLVLIPAGRRFVSTAHVADVVRGILAAAVEPSGGIFHLGEPVIRTIRTLVSELADAGDVHARIIAMPAAVVRGAGLVGDALHAVGFRGVALTSDKARELTAQHWTASTTGSLRLLGLSGFVPFHTGARATWSWYRREGWLA